MKQLLISLLAFFLLSSCQQDPNKQVDEGQVAEDTYHSEEIGWTIKIPKGWQVTSRDKLQELQDTGMEMMEESSGQKFDLSGFKQLISFQKDQFHIFQSTSETFNPEEDGDWAANNKAIKRLVYQTFASQGIRLDTSSQKEIIGGKEFEVYHVTIYGPDGQVILYQDMYGLFINGFDFGANLSYRDEDKKEEMMNAWKSSTFD
ncbi:MAG: hypothetical protein AAFY71_02640 [Bacteroidota bacterium]